eukprot:4759972-Lingulodinium_polyedra.AAC.1
MAALGLAIPHERLTYDVWDMLRGGATELRGMLDRIPHGSLLLVIGGSPCQQLTTAGRYNGRQGLAGRDSRLFYALPA